MPSTRIRWYSSRRVSELLAQVVVHFNALFCQLGVQHRVTSGIQPPQPVPALVSAFSAATVWQPLLMAEISMPLVTSKQEQICALSGSLSTPMDGLPLEACAGGSARPGFPAAQWRSIPAGAGCRSRWCRPPAPPEQGFVVWLTIRRL